MGVKRSSDVPIQPFTPILAFPHYKGEGTLMFAALTFRRNLLRLKARGSTIPNGDTKQQLLSVSCGALSNPANQDQQTASRRSQVPARQRSRS